MVETNGGDNVVLAFQEGLACSSNLLIATVSPRAVGVEQKPCLIRQGSRTSATSYCTGGRVNLT